MDFATTIGMFLACSALVTLASQVLKAGIKTYFPNVKVGFIIALVAGLSVSLFWGTGLLAGLFGLTYATAWFPLAFKITDLVLTGIVYTASSKKIVDLWENSQFSKDTNTDEN